jgi:hypothetical protein
MPKSTPAKIIAAVGAVVALAVVAFVIFGSSSNSTVDPVAQAATRSAALPGGKMLLHLTVSSPALPVTITGSGNATFDTQSHSGTVALDMQLPKSPAITQALGGNTLKLNEIIDGSTIYMQLPSVLMSALGAQPGKPWLSVNVSKLSGVPGLSSIGGNPASSNPSQMLQYLKAAGVNPTNEGSAVVDGFHTTHYHATVSASQALSRLPAASQQSLKQLLAEAHLTQIPVDVWVDSNHLVRRMQMNLKATESGQTVNEGITIDIPQYGPQKPPTIPPASEVQAVQLPAGTP